MHRRLLLAPREVHDHIHADCQIERIRREWQGRDVRLRKSLDSQLLSVPQAFPLQIDREHTQSVAFGEGLSEMTRAAAGFERAAEAAPGE